MKFILFIAMLLGLFSCCFFARSVQAIQYSGSEMDRQTQAFAGEQGAQFGEPSDPRVIMARIIKIFLTFLGILFVVYTIYGGFLFMTSGGSEEKMTKGRKIIIYGAMGGAIILSSYSIVGLVYGMIYRGTMNPFGSWFYFGVEKDRQQYYQTDPLEQDTVPFNPL